jgi:hypothetical protein
VLSRQVCRFASPLAAAVLTCLGASSAPAYDSEPSISSPRAAAVLAAPKLSARRQADGRIRIRYLLPNGAHGLTVGLFGGPVPVSRTIRVHRRRGTIRLRPLGSGQVTVRGVALDLLGRRGREAQVIVP